MEANDTLEDDLAIAEDKIIELTEENKKLNSEISDLKTKLAQFDNSMQSLKRREGTLKISTSGMYEFVTSYNATPWEVGWDTPVERNNGGGTTGTGE